MEHLDPHWKLAYKAEFEEKPSKSATTPEFCIPGSCLYVAYEGEKVLYVGESGVSVRRRFIENGNSAHNKKEWYSRVTHVYYVRFSRDELSEKYRKMVEQALAITMEPEFYGRAE